MNEIDLNKIANEMMEKEKEHRCIGVLYFRDYTNKGKLELVKDVKYCPVCGKKFPEEKRFVL